MNNDTRKRAEKAGRALLCSALASTVALGFCPVAQAAAMSTESAVTAATTKAAMGMPEILGISGIEESNFSTVDGTPVPEGIGGWAKPKYMIYGSSYNSNPNPFFANTISGEGTGVVCNKRPTTAAGGVPGLSPYGVSSNDDAVWNRLPDIVMGTLSDDITGAIDYDTPAYAGAAATAAGVSAYHPVSFGVHIVTYSDFVDNMYELADAGESVVAKSNGAKKLRYGSATKIAKAYEAYVHGTQGYILSCLKRDKAAKKTYAIVASYDEASETYTILNGSTKWGGDAAKQNRYYEVLCQVGTNLSDTVGSLTVTKEQLAKADLLVLNGEKTATGAYKASDVLQTLSSAMQKKSYYVVDNNPGAGAMMTLTKNSPDNAQNMGRVLGCLYPEYVDQDDWVAFYYDNLYHIANGKLADAIDHAMDGVANWDATSGDRTQWTTADAATYSSDDVAAKLDLGVAYIASLGTKAPAELALSTGSDGKNRFGYTAADYKKKLAVAETTKTFAAATSGKLKGKLASTKTFSAKVAGAKKGSYKLTAANKAAKKAKGSFAVSKTGKVTVKKGLAKGAYKVKVKATVASGKSSKTTATTYTVKIA